MKMSDFKYAFTVIGGGWVHIQDIYFIADNKVYYKKNFAEDEVNNHFDTMQFDYVVELDTTNLDFKTHGHNIGFDAPEITMYKIKNGVDKEIWHAGNYDNSEAVSIVQQAVETAKRQTKGFNASDQMMHSMLIGRTLNPLLLDGSLPKEMAEAVSVCREPKISQCIAYDSIEEIPGIPKETESTDFARTTKKTTSKSK